MLFRNLTMFRFPATTSAPIAALTGALGRFPLREPGPLERRVAGFVKPCEEAKGLVYVGDGDLALVCLGVNERSVPPHAIAEALEERVRKIQSQEDRVVGKKERARLKDEVIDELLPRAFVRRSLTRAYLDFHTGWIVVDTASRKNAELLVSALRQAMGSFPARYLDTQVPVRAQFTQWLVNGQACDAFEFGDECELRSSQKNGGKWVGRNVDLLSDEVGEHLVAGKQAVRLGLSHNEAMDFVLSEDLIVRKAKSRAHSDGGESFADLFFEMTAQVASLQLALEETLGVGGAGREAGTSDQRTRAENQIEMEFPERTLEHERQGDGGVAGLLTADAA
ncbi:MAG: recombination-associated protein RdgC [Sulfuricaulis sp.]